MSDLSSGKKLLFWTVLLFAPALFAFGATEVYLRLARPNLDLWVRTGRAMGPTAMAAWAQVDAFSAYRGRPGNYDEGKTVNSHGFISTPEISVEKPPHTLRVAFFGGSSTAGVAENLPDPETFPWLVAERLRASLPEKRIEFINAALPGYTSFESFGRLWSRVRFFSPDILVLNHAWNEMYYFDRFADMIRWRTLDDGSWALDRTHNALAILEPMWIDHLIWPSQVLIRLRFRFSRHIQGETVAERTADLADRYDRRALALWRTNLRLFREASDVLGTQLLVMKQPTLIVSGLHPEQQSRCRYDYHGFDHDAHVEAFQDIYRVIDQEIEPGNVIDTSVLSGKPDLFYDHVHLTPTGSTRVAEVVARDIVLAVRSRQPTASAASPEVIQPVSSTTADPD